MSRWTGSSARGGADLSVTWRDDDRFHDECGVFGVWNHPEAANVTYLGLYALQHRGQESAGIAATDGVGFHTEKAMGWVADVFSPERLRRLPGHRAIGHVRYSTAGSSNIRNAQPITATTARGPIAIAHNGNLTNAETLRRDMEKDGAIFQSNSDTEVILHLLARAPAVRLRVRVLRPARLDPLGAERPHRAEGAGAPARARAPRPRGHRHPGAGLGHERRPRLLRGVGHAVRARAHPQPLRGPHLYRTQGGHPPLRRQGEAEPHARDARGAAGRGGRRLDRPGHDEPEDRQDDPGLRRARGPRAHLVPADPVAVLLRDRHPDAEGADRVEPRAGRDPALPGRRLAWVPLARRHAEGDRARPEPLLPRVLHGQLLCGDRAGGVGPAPPLRQLTASTDDSMKPLTYREAGVDIDAGDDAVRRIAPLARSTARPEVLAGVGGFAAFVSVPARYREPVMVSSTDGVGTKLKVAFLADRHDTVGIDLVAMGVNDLLVHGAEPLYFLDYIGTARLDPARVETIVKGIVAGCRLAGCALVGGETAALPDLYAPREYDLAGFAVGVAERLGLVDGARVRPGDVVLGLPSSGLHSNGYTLARRIVFDVMKLTVDALLPGTGRTVGDELLTPTRIYAKPVLALLPRAEVHAMAHVTGGGLPGNLPRVLPEGCRARISRTAWTPPPVFATLQHAGGVADTEMFRAFNMGIGYVIVLPPKDVDRATDVLRDAGETVLRLGEIVAGERGVELAA